MRLLYLGLILLLFSCSSKKPVDVTLFFDFEEKSEQVYDQYRSMEKASFGQYSLKIPPKTEIKIYTLDDGDLRDLKVKVNSLIFANSDSFYIALNGDGYDFTKNNKTIETPNEWKKLNHLRAFTPNFKGSKIDVLLINNSSQPVYIDNLELIAKSEVIYPEIEGVEKISLIVPEEEFSALETHRYNAFRYKYIPKSSKKSVKSNLVSGSKYYEIAIRLKGDWHDHLMGDKWSFRVKSETDSVFTFNLQRPETRDFLMEYVYHRLLEKVGILTTDYSFVNLSINERSLGLYAKEEHIDEAYLKTSNKRGIVLKFDDLVCFQMFSGEIKDTVDALDISEIRMYSSEDIEDSNIENAVQLLNSYRKYDKRASAIFDIPKMAKYHAISDLCRAYHALVWINVRFYYDPITKKLEPIGYDGYGGKKSYTWGNPFVAYSKDSIFETNDRARFTVRNSFNDPKLIDAYYAEIESLPFDSLLQDVFEEVKQLEEIVQQEYPEYQFDYSFYQKALTDIQTNLKFQVEQHKYPKFILTQ